MKKEIKIIIAGVIIFLLLLIIAFVDLFFKKGGFDWSLLLDAFTTTVIGIGIAIIVSVIVYLLFNWIEK